MRCFTGTSGFSYNEWKGHFYPADIKATDMLSFYARHLSAVEINNTFYRMPKRDVLAGWRDATPTSFRFVIKASRRITHFKRLKDADEPMSFLKKNVATLGDRLGAILFQLPPNLRCSTDRLDAFLELVPEDLPVAFEFRHPSWQDDAVHDRLRSRNVAVCHADSGKGEEPLVSTADWGYLRLRQPGYTEEELNKWLGRIIDAGWHEAHVFFKHEDDGAGPALAARFAALAESREVAIASGE